MIYLSSITDFEQQVLNYFCPPTKTVQKEADASSFSWFVVSEYRVSNIQSPHCLLLSIWKPVNEHVCLCLFHVLLFYCL